MLSIFLNLWLMLLKTHSRLNSVYHRYCIKTLTDHKEWIRCVRPSPDGSLLASGSNDRSVRVWVSANVRECKSLVALHGHEHVVECLAWLTAPPNIPYAQLACAIIAVTNGNASQRLPEQQLQINGEGEAMDDTSVPVILASGARDRQICIWDVKAATCLFTLVSSSDPFVRK